MGLKTLYLREHEGMAHNPIGQLSSSSIPSMAWWTSYGSQSIYDDCKSLSNEQKSLQVATNLQTNQPEYHAQIGLGFSQPMLCAKYPPDQCYGIFSTYGSLVPGRIMLPIATDDGPIFVNPKQYHGIMRRRKSRAKAVLENRPTNNRKPFMHLSRHLHAMRRLRGTGGRFLNTKSSKNDIQAKKVYEPTGPQSSEVLVSSNSGTLNSENSGGSHVSGTEVTSNMYSGGDLEQFSINHLGDPAHLGHFSINHLV